MSPVDLLGWAQLAASLGLGAGGLGVLKWGFNVERRLMRLEVKAKVTV